MLSRGGHESSIGLTDARGADTNEAPFGTLAPTLLQAVLIGAVSDTPWSHGQVRWATSALIERIRSGPVDVNRLGFKLRLHHYGRNYSEKRMLLSLRNYENDTRAFFRSRCRPGFRFADVGAHAGLYSFFVKSVAPDSKIVAFEPHPAYARRMRFNIEANHLSGIAVVEAAVGAEYGEGNFGEQSFFAAERNRKVDIVPLYESLLEAGFTGLDGLKIDVEGYEDRVLFPFFEKAPREFWPRAMTMEHSKYFLWERDCLKLCASVGYETVWRDDRNIALELSEGKPGE
jgi:FkbM family methyltransferase